MTTHDDNPLASRFAALAPNPLPGDWGEVLGRVDVARGRRQLTGSRVAGRRRLFVVFAVVALVAVVTASALAVRAFNVDQGFVGLPPEGATPSAPESGDLIVQWEGWTPPLSPLRAGQDTVDAWVYADGRIIWFRRAWHGTGTIPGGANEFTSGYLEQRLAPEGVEIVRAAVAELFDRSRAFVDTMPLENQQSEGPPPRFALFVPSDYAYRGTAAVPVSDHLARLQALDIFFKDDPSLDGKLATPEQLAALRRVNLLLSDPASVLPSSAWAEQKVQAYVPSHYAVCIDTTPPKTASELLSLLPARAADLLRDKSRTQLAGGTEKIYDGTVVDTPGVKDCYKVETEDARRVADALSGLVPEDGSGDYWLSWRVDEAPEGTQAGWNPTDITIEPVLPDGRIPTSAPYG